MGKHRKRKSENTQKPSKSTPPPLPETPDSKSGLKMERNAVSLSLLLLILIGGYFRFKDLGVACLGPDRLEFYKVCQTGLSPVQIYARIMDFGGLMPFWFAVTQGTLQILNLELNPGTFRLPTAAIGTVSILIIFLAGSKLLNSRVGLLAALFMATQPFHIQMSREVYFYAPMVAGVCLGLWSIIWMARCIAEKTSLSLGFYPVAIMGFLITSHIHGSGWPFSLVMGLTTCCGAFYYYGVRQKKYGPFFILSTCYFIIGLPVLVAPWGLTFIVNISTGETREYWLETLTRSQFSESFLENAFRILFGYSWGTGILPVLWATIALFSGCVLLVLKWKSLFHFKVFTSLFVISLVMVLIAHGLYPSQSDPRHYASIFPFWTILLSLGSYLCAGWLYRNFTGISGAASAGMIIASLPVLLPVLMNIKPAWISTQIHGDPPFREIAEWADKALPSGTPVLCDRFFTAYNEFIVNPATNVYFMSTTRNEPKKVYFESKWREGAKNFFKNNPDAAMYEQKMLWNQIGPWTWPHEYFYRKKVFADHATMNLREQGLAYRGRAPSVPIEYTKTTIYYNTPEDIADKEKKAGKSCVAIYAPGWKYVKTQDMRDWRLFETEGAVYVFNLTNEKLSIDLFISAAAVGNDRIIVLETGNAVVFPAQRLTEAKLGTISLAPGKSTVRIRDVSTSNSQGVLLSQRLYAAPHKNKTETH